MQNVPIFRVIAEAGVTESRVREIMAAFYAEVRADPVLGGVFRAAIGDGDWSAHIEKVTAFWLKAFRLEENYNGRDFMPAHLRHLHIRLEHAPLWLALFEATVDRLCSPQEARAFRAVAVAMIENLEMGLAKRDNIETPARVRPP